MVWRLMDSRGMATDPFRLALLAVASALFTAIFEIFWTWVYQDVEPAWTFGMNFTLDFGISPAWKVLGLGLLIAVGAMARRGFALQPSPR